MIDKVPNKTHNANPALHTLFPSPRPRYWAIGLADASISDLGVHRDNVWNLPTDHVVPELQNPQADPASIATSPSFDTNALPHQRVLHSCLLLSGAITPKQSDDQKRIEKPPIVVCVSSTRFSDPRAVLKRDTGMRLMIPSLPTTLQKAYYEGILLHKRFAQACVL